MIVLDHAPYTPFMEPRTARPPGLAPLDMRDWTVRLPDFAAQMAYRRRLLAEQPEVVLGALPEGEEPALELLEMLLAHLGEPRPLTQEERFCALTAIGRLVPEDFCLLVPDAASGEYRLVAAVLCFPSRWLLSEKLGRPLTPIHTPVPGYAGALSKRVNRVFEALRPDRPLVRVNWSVQPTPELFLPQSEAGKSAPAEQDRPVGPSGAPARPPAASHGATSPKPLSFQAKSVNGSGARGAGVDDWFFLRTERQTLVRLPRTGAVAFGIKTSVTPVEQLSSAQAAALARELGQLGEGMVAYKGGRARVDAAIARLDEIACAGTAPTSSLA